ncbi:ABC-type sugar transport system permease subunit [Friedmanniella endophytica]|uniref:ABC-type sugar transport system permease subunit n=1 Tax=Microlunatus kandeliicorticis TaxID=1759536 RepID=A0A7W3IUK2_9ACTN|nr:sugar ABC transporter permease [Microlunatus kandeliicorticis]MBA8795536.1 ABC-type sugar transport system permease subunit [Microlunatus kandeliicorticis]
MAGSTTVVATERRPAATVRPQRRRSVRRLVLERLAAVAFLLPTLALIGVFSYYPAVRAGVTAFTRWDGFNPPVWVGVQNFTQAFGDPDFLRSAVNVAIWTLFGVPLAMVPSFVVAELIFRLRSDRAQFVWRAVFVAPLIIPPVVSILIWQFLYGPNGPINTVLHSVGLGELARSWIADPKFALWALIFLGFPWVSSFNVLIFYSGLKAIPREVIEASALEGAGRFRQLVHIELPLIAGQWKLLLVLSIIGVTQNLTVPLLLTNGGPGNATLTPVLYMYQRAIDYGQYGFGMAVGTLLFVVVLALSIINMRVLRTRS